MYSACRNKLRKDKPHLKKPMVFAKKPVEIKVTPRVLTGLSRVFKQLGDESRLKILLALGQEGELHVSALCDLLNQTQPAVSHHLTLLRMSGLVGYRRQGKNNFYRVESGLVCDLLGQLFLETGNSSQAIDFTDFNLAFKRK
jgi:ArsR family transcriptional regulator, arsenate/arsenite/antimonite-responsive transcriptional repressor